MSVAAPVFSCQHAYAAAACHGSEEVPLGTGGVTPHRSPALKRAFEPHDLVGARRRSVSADEAGTGSIIVTFLRSNDVPAVNPRISNGVSHLPSPSGIAPPGLGWI